MTAIEAIIREKMPLAVSEMVGSPANTGHICYELAGVTLKKYASSSIQSFSHVAPSISPALRWKLWRVSSSPSQGLRGFG